jgi:hypothetical protein
MKRWFNTAGECNPAYHYMVPAEERLPDAGRLIEQMSYFVVHAPRQTGKTTALSALTQRLTADGQYAALTFTCEVGAIRKDDFAGAERMIIGDMRDKAAASLPLELRPPILSEAPPDRLLTHVLRAWAETCPRPLVLVFDEIDALTGDSLLYILHQLRAGFRDRPRGFPASVILCGLRDVRDYKLAAGGDLTRLGTSSPFNIKVSSMRLGNFTPAQVRELYTQHTADTGQPFTEEALDRAFALTGGQPWLVNALARKAVYDLAIAPPAPITIDHIEEAKEQLILERATHLDSLVHKLREPRVRKVIEPIIAGESVEGGEYDDDASYVRDLGLVTGRPLAIANPIYREVIVRVLSTVAEDHVTAPPERFRLPDGRLAYRRMLRAFAAFWREHGEPIARAIPYSEVAAQLVFMAFMQRIVNGGGYIDREYGIGRGRIDLLVRFPYKKADGSPAVQRRALEIKVWRKGRPDPLKKGLEQLDEYLRKLGMSRGTLVIFDARGRFARREPKFEQKRTPSKREVTVLRA